MLVHQADITATVLAYSFLFFHFQLFVELLLTANLLTDRTVTSSSAAAAFSAAAHKLWNTLPDHLRAPCSFPVVKSGLKTHLFRQAFDSCDIH